MFLNLEIIFLYFFVKKESDYICEQESRCYRFRLNKDSKTLIDRRFLP
jgi:hypothetical protein